MNMDTPPQVNPRTKCEDKLVDQGYDDPTSPKPDDSIICIHRKLNPAKAKNMKRIRRVSVVPALCYIRINFSRLFIRR